MSNKKNNVWLVDGEGFTAMFDDAIEAYRTTCEKKPGRFTMKRVLLSPVPNSIPKYPVALLERFKCSFDNFDYRFEVGKLYEQMNFYKYFVRMYVVPHRKPIGVWDYIPPRKVDTILIPCYHKIVYEVANDGFLHIFDGIYGLKRFIQKKNPTYNEAKYNFIKEMERNSYWPYSSTEHLHLCEELKRMEISDEDWRQF